MSAGSRIVIQRNGENGWEDYLACHVLDANPKRSREFQEAGGEQATQTVTFVLRWRKALEAVEYDMPDFRIVWRGHEFDVRGYDDYKYRHMKVTLEGVARD